MNKITVGTISCLLTLNCAQVMSGTMGPIHTQEPYNGVYIGADIGASSLYAKELVTLAQNERHHMGTIGIVGGGLIGYDYSFNDPLKMGVEGFINANGLNISGITSYQAQSTYNWGFRALPGYAVHPGTVGHIILGYSNAHFNVRNDRANANITHSTNQNGFQSGLGFTALMLNNLSLRVDGLYTTYSAQQNNGFATNLVGINTYRTNFSTLETDLTLSYKFA